MTGHESPSEALEDRRRPLYTIGQVAELLGTGQPAVRRLEDLHFVSPVRSQGGHRRYSREDLETLHEVTELSREGITPAGIHRILELRARVRELEEELRTTRGGTPAPTGTGAGTGTGTGDRHP